MKDTRHSIYSTPNPDNATLPAVMGRGLRWLGGGPGAFLGLGALTTLLEAAHGQVFGAPPSPRPAVLQGEPWRLLTGQLVHASPVHLFWNLAGLGLVWIAFGPRLTAVGWILAGLASGLGAGRGVLAFEPQVRAMSDSPACSTA